MCSVRERLFHLRKSERGEAHRDAWCWKGLAETWPYDRDDRPAATGPRRGWRSAEMIRVGGRARAEMSGSAGFQKLRADAPSAARTSLQTSVPRHEARPGRRPRWWRSPPPPLSPRRVRWAPPPGEAPGSTCFTGISPCLRRTPRQRTFWSGDDAFHSAGGSCSAALRGGRPLPDGGNRPAASAPGFEASTVSAGVVGLFPDDAARGISVAIAGADWSIPKVPVRMPSESTLINLAFSARRAACSVRSLVHGYLLSRRSQARAGGERRKIPAIISVAPAALAVEVNSGLLTYDSASARGELDH